MIQLGRHNDESLKVPTDDEDDEEIEDDDVESDYEEDEEELKRHKRKVSGWLKP